MRSRSRSRSSSPRCCCRRPPRRRPPIRSSRRLPRRSRARRRTSCSGGRTACWRSAAAGSSPTPAATSTTSSPTSSRSTNRRSTPSSISGDFGISIGSRFDVIATLEQAETLRPPRSTATSSTPAGVPITQTTLREEWIVSGTVRMALLPRGRRISRFAWVPRTFTPYVGVGAGGAKYNIKQYGAFVDFRTLRVFNDELRLQGLDADRARARRRRPAALSTPLSDDRGPLHLGHGGAGRRLRRLRSDLARRAADFGRACRSCSETRTAMTASIVVALDRCWRAAPRRRPPSVRRSDDRWQPWLGCWRADDDGAGTGARTCVTPGPTAGCRSSRSSACSRSPRRRASPTTVITPWRWTTAAAANACAGRRAAAAGSGPRRRPAAPSRRARCRAWRS